MILILKRYTSTSQFRSLFEVQCPSAPKLSPLLHLHSNHPEEVFNRSYIGSFSLDRKIRIIIMTSSNCPDNLQGIHDCKIKLCTFQNEKADPL